jgi:hypothetical protein
MMLKACGVQATAFDIPVLEVRNHKIDCIITEVRLRLLVSYKFGLENMIAITVDGRERRLGAANIDYGK